MHLNWYDQRLLAFVLDWAPRSEPPNHESRGWFGVDTRRVMRRFDAVVDVCTTHPIPLEEPDLSLVRRAVDFRAAHPG
jgi:hypothetical protein